METLVFVTQLIDPDDPVLGFVVPQIRALDRALRRRRDRERSPPGPGDLSAEVVSLGKEHGAGRLARGARYVAERWARRRGGTRRGSSRTCARCTSPWPRRSRRSAGCRRMLWFVHPADSPLLRATERLSDAVLTAARARTRGNGPKIHAIGHAIDTGSIVPTPIRRDPERRSACWRSAARRR